MIVGYGEPTGYRFFLLTTVETSPEDALEVKVKPVKNFTVEDFNVKLFKVVTNCGELLVPDLFNVLVFEEDKLKVISPSELKSIVDSGIPVKTTKDCDVIEVIESGETNEFTIFDVVENPNKFREFLLIFDYGFIEVKPMTLATLTSRLIGEEIAKIVTDTLPGILELEFEKVYDFILLVTKKKYSALKFSLKLDFTGLEYVRGEWSPEAKELQKNIIELIMQYDTNVAKKKIVKYIRNEIRRYKSLNFNVSDIVTRKRAKNREEYVDPEKIPQYKAKEILEKKGMFVPSGSFVEYVVLKVPSKVFEKILKGEKVVKKYNTKSIPVSKRVYPIEVVEDEELLKEYIDVDYIIDNQILPPALRVTTVIGINEKLFTDHNNTKIDDYFSIATASKKDVKTKNEVLSKIDV